MRGFHILLQHSSCVDKPHVNRYRKNSLNRSWCTRCRIILADWMPNKHFLVDYPGPLNKAFKPGLSRLKRDVCYAYADVIVYASVFYLFAAAEPSANVCVAHGALWDDPSVCIVATAWKCGCKFCHRQFRRNPWQPLTGPGTEFAKKTLGGQIFIVCVSMTSSCSFNRSTPFC